MKRLRRWDRVLAVAVAAAFALRCLLLIDATGLWSDELYLSLIHILTLPTICSV